MPEPRPGRVVVLGSAALLLLISIAANAFLAYRIVYPPRTLKIRILTDASNPSLKFLPEDLRSRVEMVSPLFERAADIQLKVIGFSKFSLENQKLSPNYLQNLIKVRVPLDGADILVLFLDDAPDLGSAPPFSPVVVVPLNSGTPRQNGAVLAHQLARAFGVNVSTDPRSVMFTHPNDLAFDSSSKKQLFELRGFDFSAGLAGMSHSMQSRVVNALAQRSNGGDGAARLLLAGMLVRDQQWPEAIKQYRSALRSDPKNVQARIGLVHALAANQEYADAETEAKAAIDLAPNSADAHYEMGYALARHAKPESAVDELRKAVNLDPRSARNHAGLAVAYFANIGEFAASDSEFAIARQLDPNDAYVLADLEYVTRQRARIDQQTRDAASAVKAKPGNAEVRTAYALLLLRQGQVDQSMAEVREALKIGPEHWRMHYALAVAYYSKHDFNAARQEMDLAKKLGSGSRPHLEDLLAVALQKPPARSTN